MITLHPSTALNHEVLPQFKCESFSPTTRHRVSNFLVGQGQKSSKECLCIQFCPHPLRSTIDRKFYSITEGWEDWLEAEFKKTIPVLPTSVFANFNSEEAVLPNFETSNSK